MGYKRLTEDDLKTFTATMSTRGSANEIYTSSDIADIFKPYGVKVRESRDSEANPNSTAIIFGLDVTGSMDQILEKVAKDSLPRLCSLIYDMKPVTDPAIMVCAIDDVVTSLRDRKVFQLSQFESGTELLEQLQMMYLVRRGGGNDSESYTLPWYVGAKMTSIDCWEKRRQKGWIFTLGDESVPERIEIDELQQIFGGEIDTDIYTPQRLLQLASEKYNVVHLMAAQTSHFRGHRSQIVGAWRDLMGSNAVVLEDQAKLPEVVISLMMMNAGQSVDDIITNSGWDADTARVVRAATTV